MHRSPEDPQPDPEGRYYSHRGYAGADVKDPDPHHDVTAAGYDSVEAEAYPRNLQVKLEDEELKNFPIVPKTTGTVRDGYVLGDIEAVPEHVSIRGPESVVDTVPTGAEATVNVSGLSQDDVTDFQAYALR